MRKQGRMLGDIADVPHLGRQKDMLLAIEQDTTIQGDVSFIWMQQTRQAAQGEAFACSRNAQQSGKAQRDVNLDIELKPFEAAARVEREFATTLRVARKEGRWSLSRPHVA